MKRLTILSEILCSLLVLTAFFGMVLTVSTEHMILHDEPTVMSIAAAYVHGQPMYTSREAVADYSLLYGPATYLVYAPLVIAGADSVRPFLILVSIGLLGAFLCVYGFSCGISLGYTFYALGIFAAMVLGSSINEWAVKNDVWILFLIALALYAAIRLPTLASAIVIAFCGAFTVSMKFTTALLVVLPCIVLWQRSKAARKEAYLSLGMIGMLAIGIFLLPRISLHEYILIVRDASGHGISRRIFIVNMKRLLIMVIAAIPVLWSVWRFDPPGLMSWVKWRRYYVFFFLIGTLVMLVTGSKNGAGPWHLMPALPPLLFLLSDMLRHISKEKPPTLLDAALSLPLCIGVLFFAVQGMRWAKMSYGMRMHGLPSFSGIPPAAVEDDIKSVLKTHPSQYVQMGYGTDRTYDLTFMRPVIQFQGNPLFVDGDVFNEESLIGNEPSNAMLLVLQTCSVNTWLVPKGDDPFVLHSLYYLDGLTKRPEMFPKVFRTEFLAKYHRTGSSQYFDLWTCK